MQHYSLKLYTLNICCLSNIHLFYTRVSNYIIENENMKGKNDSKRFKIIVCVALKDSIFRKSFEVVVYIVFEHCKHSKTVIKIKFANLKPSTVNTVNK